MLVAIQIQSHELYEPRLIKTELTINLRGAWPTEI